MAAMSIVFYVSWDWVSDDDDEVWRDSQQNQKVHIVDHLQGIKSYLKYKTTKNIVLVMVKIWTLNTQ